MSAQQRLTCPAKRPDGLARHYSTPSFMSSENQERSKRAFQISKEHGIDRLSGTVVRAAGLWMDKRLHRRFS
jgi:hypothetical protein